MANGILAKIIFNFGDTLHIYILCVHILLCALQNSVMYLSCETFGSDFH